MILSSTSPYALLNEFYIACGKAEQYRFSQFFEHDCSCENQTAMSYYELLFQVRKIYSIGH